VASHTSDIAALNHEFTSFEHSGKKFRQARWPQASSRCSGRQLGNLCRRTDVAGFVPDSAGFDLVFGFAFCVEVAAIYVVYYRNGKVLHLQTAKGLGQALQLRI
jgi:hypothetical protein